MNRIQLSDEINNAKKYLGYYEGIKANCTDCSHNSMGHCKLHGSQIPDEFITQGCDEWRHDGVPF